MSTFSASGKILVFAIVDSAGNRVDDATIVSSSGHKYPTGFASAVALTASPNPSVAGEPVTLAATITSFGRPTGVPLGPPTGKVTFTDTTTGVTLGHVTLSPSGMVSLTTSSLPVGTDTIKATYSGDDWSISSHATVSQVVN